MSPRDLAAYNIYEEKVVTLDFEGGLTVSGKIITGKRNLQGKIILISFTPPSTPHRHHHTIWVIPTTINLLCG
jgi:phenylalanine-4-hydroxylase